MELKLKPNNELFETYPNISNRKTSKQKQILSHYKQTKNRIKSKNKFFLTNTKSINKGNTVKALKTSETIVAGRFSSTRN
jgi:hypothetical protein